MERIEYLTLSQVGESIFGKDDENPHDYARHMRNFVGSGKVYTQIINGVRMVPDWEFDRLRDMREECPSWYVIWFEERVAYVDSGYAAHRAGYCQEAIVEHFN